MGKFVKGDVVIIPFPFSNLKGNKKRPALVITDLPGDDFIACQITSKANIDSFALPLSANDFIFGSLPVDSFVHPSKIFTADKNLVLSVAGHLSEAKINDVIHSVIAVISS